MWLHGVHVSPYGFATGYGRADPDRSRKLLLHRRQIADLAKQTQQGALTLVPLSVYFKDGRAKVDLALARGRREYDKRRAIADREPSWRRSGSWRAGGGREHNEGWGRCGRRGEQPQLWAQGPEHSPPAWCSLQSGVHFKTAVEVVSS